MLARDRGIPYNVDERLEPELESLQGLRDTCPDIQVLHLDFVSIKGNFKASKLNHSYVPMTD